MARGRYRERRSPSARATRRRLMIRELFATAVMAISALSPSVAPAEAPRPEDAYTETLIAREYRIGPEDTLQIAVWKNDPISKTVPVRPDGMISLPLLNDIRAAGL